MIHSLSGLRHRLDNGGTAVQARRVMYTVLALAGRELRVRYANSWLGAAWALLQPLASMGIYLVFFGVVFQYGRADGDAKLYALLMVAGLLPFQAFSDALHRSCGSLRSDKSLLESAEFPAVAVPLARVVGAAVPELIGLALLLPAIAVWGPPLGPALLLLPVLVVLRLLLTAGAVLWISILAVLVNDVTEMLAFGLTALLFLTPVFYTPDQLPTWLHWTLWINPMHHVVSAYRAVLLDGAVPWAAGGALLLWALASWTSGLWFFRRGIDATKDML